MIDDPNDFLREYIGKYYIVSGEPAIPIIIKINDLKADDPELPLIYRNEKDIKFFYSTNDSKFFMVSISELENNTYDTLEEAELVTRLQAESAVLIENGLDTAVVLFGHVVITGTENTTISIKYTRDEKL